MIPGATIAAAVAAMATPAAMAIRRICVLWRTPPTRFRAAIGSIAFGSSEMAAWPGMRRESQARPGLSSGGRRVFGPPQVVGELPIWTVRPPAPPKVIGPPSVRVCAQGARVPDAWHLNSSGVRDAKAAHDWKPAGTVPRTDL